ncbi:hypothetical protein KI387_022899, partial [Taxus chinensis]
MLLHQLARDVKDFGDSNSQHVLIFTLDVGREINHQVEALAMPKGLQLAILRGLKNSIVEGDSKIIINALNGNKVELLRLK